MAEAPDTSRANSDKPPRRGDEKSASAFRTISEVSVELDLPQHVLRFWETKFPAVKPLKRGGGRRYYRPGDIALLKRIRSLLYDEGYTIKGVQKLLRDGLGGASEGKGTDSGQTAHGARPSPAHESNRQELKAILGDLEKLRGMLLQGASN